MNRLVIDNAEEFDHAVWQTPSGFNDERYNQWLKNSVEILLHIRNEIEECKEIDIRPSEVYIMGDVINMLSVVTIEIKS